MRGDVLFNGMRRGFGLGTQMNLYKATRIHDHTACGLCGKELIGNWGNVRHYCTQTEIKALCPQISR